MALGNIGATLAEARSAGVTVPVRSLGRSTTLPKVTRPLSTSLASAALAIKVPVDTSQPFLEPSPLPPVPVDMPTGSSVAYTQHEADEAANKIPVTLIAAGVGAVAVGLFVALQLRKKR